MAWKARRAALLVAAALCAVPMGAVPAAAQERAEWAPEAIDAYAWIDRADSLSETIGEAPPDYAFAYDAGEPWAWVLDDGSLVIAEQGEDGPRSYYFDPESEAPFLVRDSERSFAYDRGDVAVIYGADGAVLDRAEGSAWLESAMEAWRRGRALRRAWLRRVERPVAAAAWIDFSIYMIDWGRRWDEGKRRHWRWRRWREQHGWEHHRRLEEERRRREAIAERFRRWREARFHGAPPGRWQRPHESWRPSTPDTRPNRPNRPGRSDGVTPRPRPEMADGTTPPRPERRADEPRPRRWSRAGRDGPAPGATPGAPAPASAPAPRRLGERSGSLPPRATPAGAPAVRAERPAPAPAARNTPAPAVRSTPVPAVRSTPAPAPSPRAEHTSTRDGTRPN